MGSSSLIQATACSSARRSRRSSSRILPSTCANTRTCEQTQHTALVRYGKVRAPDLHCFDTRLLGRCRTSLSHLWSPCYTGFISHDIVVTRWRGMLAPGTHFSMRICSAIHSLSCQQRASGNIMAKPRVTATDRLANVIEVVELGQRTGLLSAERGSGSVLEEGALYFASGRVMYASLAGLRGREALAALGRWGACRFSFDSNVQPPIPNITAVFPIPDMPPQMRRGASPPPSGPPASVPGQRRADSGVWPSQPGTGQAGTGDAGTGDA